MASSFRDLFCGCFLSHICTRCTQEGVTSIHELPRSGLLGNVSVRSILVELLALPYVRPLSQRVSFLLVLYPRLGIFEDQLVYMLVPDLLALPE